MPEALSRFQQQISDFWSNLDKSQKTRIYITTSILVVAIAIGLFMVARPSYTTLISNADSKDMAEMQKILDEKKVAYKLTDDKKGIMVNEKDSDKAHMELVNAGYPKNGMTFADALKSIKINSTESDKKHIWGELTKSDIVRMLKMVDFVEDANINITMPEKTMFLDENGEQPRPTAAVYITPRGELTAKQVEGIVMMVARSVEGLEPKDVTVIDNNGRILSNESGDETIEKTSSQYEMKKKVKDDLEKSVRDMLNGQFDSFDSVRVKVNPILDFDKLKSQSKEYNNPEGMDGPAVISSETSKEKLVNGDKGSVPGTDTNPGDADAPSYPMGGNTNNSTYDKQHDVKNYGYNETSKEQEKAVGEVIPEKSTAAVTILYGARVKDDSKLSPEFLQQVREIASNATGIPAKNISISKLKTAMPEEVQTPMSDTIKEMVNTYGLPLLLLVLAVILMIAVIPRKKAQSTQPDVIVAQTASGPRFIVPDAPAEPLPEIDVEEKSEVKKQIDKFVKQRPEAVAQLLRNWLTDEWD
ncbi:MAG: flagellar basal-body MS-ring/collar protein FliF [Clostridia bacterium]|nr:flagellar basal-body MS-ring/collar protein FliF [Clostridia bacterium]